MEYVCDVVACCVLRSVLPAPETNFICGDRTIATVGYNQLIRLALGQHFLDSFTSQSSDSSEFDVIEVGMKGGLFSFGALVTAVKQHHQNCSLFLFSGPSRV